MPCLSTCCRRKPLLVLLLLVLVAFPVGFWHLRSTKPIELEVYFWFPPKSLVVGWGVPVIHWGVPLPRGNAPSPELMWSGCRTKVARRVHCNGTDVRPFMRKWDKYLKTSHHSKAFAIDSTCTNFTFSFSSGMGNGLCSVVRHAVSHCGTNCMLLHAEPVACVHPFNWESSIRPLDQVGRNCTVDVFQGAVANGAVQRFYSGTWPLSHSAGSFNVHGVMGCAARFFEMPNLTGWSGTFGRGTYLGEDISSLAPGGGTALQVGRIVPNNQSLCANASKRARYAVMTDPCGLIHGGQGIGALLTSYQMGMQVAHRLGAEFLHNPRVLCQDRHNAGYVAERLFQFDYCAYADARQRAEQGEIPVVTIASGSFGIHTDTKGGPDGHGWRQLIEEPFNSVLFKNALQQANLRELPEEVLIEIQGCPFVRNWGLWGSSKVDMGTQRVAGKLLRQALVHGFHSQNRALRWCHLAVRIAVHFRYGDVGLACGKKWDNADCKGSPELTTYYHSNATLVVQLLQQIMTTISIATPLKNLDVQMVVFSQGQVDDPPFQEFANTFPAMEVRLSDSHEDEVPDSNMAADIFQMASADILISTCGTFTTAIGILNNCGVVFAPACSFSMFGNAPCQPALEFDDQGFDPKAFDSTWQKVYKDKVLPRQLSGNVF